MHELQRQNFNALYNLLDSERVERGIIHTVGDLLVLFVVESRLCVDRNLVCKGAGRTFLPSFELIRPAAGTSKILPLTSKTKSVTSLFNIIFFLNFRPLLRLLPE